MKKLLSIIIILCMSLSLASCTKASLSGEPTEFYSSDKSFSIELPSNGEDSWVIDEETDGNLLSMTDTADTVNVRVQCMSKKQAAHIAPDLESYKNHVLTYTFGELMGEASLSDISMDVPEFITGSTAGTFTAKKGSEGVIVFMESPQCFYTYLILTVEGGYDANKKALNESVLSLKEITTIQ